MRHVSCLLRYALATLLVCHAAATPTSLAQTRLPGAQRPIEAADYASLQAAIDALPPTGGVVRFPVGRFEISEPLVVETEDALLIGEGTATEIVNTNTAGKPAIIMPYVWDGHDNATRVQETGHGFKMPRYDWTDADLAAKLDACMHDPAIKAKLAATSAHMKSQRGPAKAAGILDTLLKKGRYDA